MTGTGTASTQASRSLEDLVDQLEEVVGWITALDPYAAHAPTAAGASRRVSAAMSRLYAQRLGWIARVEADGLWALDTMHSFTSWLAWSENLPHAVARRTVHEARAVRDTLPHTGERARRGEITAEHLRTVASHAATSEARRAALAAPIPEAAPATWGDDTTSGAADSPDAAAPRGVAAAPDASGAPDAASSRQPRTGEDVLLDLARTCTHSQFVRAARHFAAITDPEACDRGFRDAAEREFVDLAATLGGYHLSGFLTEEHGQIVKTALRAVTGVPSAGDRATGPQRRAVALTGIARTLLDHGLSGPGAAVRPHLQVLVSWSELERCLRRVRPGPGGRAEHPVGRAAPADWADPADRADPANSADPADWADLEAILAAGPATWEDGTGPVPDRVLRRIAADCDLSRVVFGPRSEVLNVGRAQRTFTGSRRRAVIARDRTCVWPSCTAPPQVGEIHHAQIHWADGGVTSTENAALLCWFHHRHVDRHGIAMRRTAQGWAFGAPGSYGTGTGNRATAGSGADAGGGAGAGSRVGARSGAGAGSRVGARSGAGAGSRAGARSGTGAGSGTGPAIGTVTAPASSAAATVQAGPARPG